MDRPAVLDELEQAMRQLGEAREVARQLAQDLRHDENLLEKFAASRAVPSMPKSGALRLYDRLALTWRS